MKQQPDNNTDRLFRQAADHYPLNTKNNNWDIVAARLNEQKLIVKRKKDKQRQLAALLLLITMISFGVYRLESNSVKPKQVSLNVVNKSASEPLPKAQEKTSILGKPVENNTTEPKQAILSFEPKNSADFSLQADKNSTTEFSSGEHAAGIKAQILNKGLTTSLKSLNNFELAEVEYVNNNIYNPGLILQTLNQNSKISFVNKADESKNAVQQKKSTHIKINARPSAHFYGTFFISPDFSTVKFQQLNAPGLKIGVQLGYTINNNFSTEINLVRYHSDFYSLGKYFDRTQAKVNSNTKINDVYGKSKMTEVPFDIRYNLPKTNNRFFVTAGTNLVLFTHTEQYKYDVTKSNGANANFSRHFNAISGTKYFSSLSFSAGYEAPLLRSFKVKAEPYYQIPTKNFGIGNLPVTHFGVNIGIVKDLK